MTHQRQKPRKRKTQVKKPQQKVHKINGRHTRSDITRHIMKLREEGKLNEAINSGEFADDTIPDLIQETISGVYRITTMLCVVDSLLKEGTIKLIPGYSAVRERWDRQMIRFEENAETYLVLKEHHVTTVESDDELDEEERKTELKDDSNLADIVYDLVESINELFLNCALEITDLTKRHEETINAYIDDHVLENETRNDYAIRVTQAHIERIRPIYRTQLTGTVEETAVELMAELTEGTPHV